MASLSVDGLVSGLDTTPPAPPPVSLAPPPRPRREDPMVSLSVDGLVSGLDTTSLVSQLVAAEALPQTRLKNQMSAAQAAADAYREVNTKVDAVRTAAAALTANGLAAARTASSSA